MKIRNPDNDNEQKEFLFAFERFEIYQRAIDFTDDIHNITKQYPEFERREMWTQLRRASNSVSLNLAEGFSSYYKDEKKRFFRIARGSIYECVPALKISHRQGYIGSEDHWKLYQECYEIARRISGLIRSVDNRLEANDKNKSK